MDVGQTLDGKYHIERELGRGGMGTVYLATHLGTERPVAVKIIAPQFMERIEFVERFRREARAAGRLRHPNVVNVTDFGFSESPDGRIAYLVMEYLDGCTLGEILDEEKNLPVAWTLDILEQVCSAVHEAHSQGIIHRDLKPDNIWLEPNQRGGYTVKVLDFGIAKLEEHTENGWTGEHAVFETSQPTHHGVRTTIAGAESDSTLVEASAHTHHSDGATAVKAAKRATLLSEAGTIQLSPVVPEGETVLFSEDEPSIERSNASIESEPSFSKAPTTGRSLYDSTSSGELTRVGSVLGTPLYMSPEQCRGEHLDPRSDIYSLGVIAYQMLSGRTPFEGDFKAVMEAHQHIEPSPLKAKRVRKKLRRGIHSALSKDPEFRPQSAEAFASELRSRSEGIWGLLRKALVIESEHLPKFLLLTTLLFIPSSILTLSVLGASFLKVSETVNDTAANIAIGVLGVALALANAFSGVLILGSITWIVTQYLAVPLRPVRVRPALREAKKKWRRFAGAGALAAVLPFTFGAIGAAIGFAIGAAILGMLYPITDSVGAIFVAGIVGAVILGLVGFFGAYINWMLAVPVVMMENSGILASFKRSRHLVRRSFATTAAAAMFMFLIPMVAAGSISYIVNVSAKAFDPKPPPIEKPEAVSAAGDTATEKANEGGLNWSFSTGGGSTNVKPAEEGRDMRTQVKRTLLESLIQTLMLPIQIFVFSFTGIIVALLYIKTRLAGGESMNDLIERFEDDGRPRKKWQERVRQRLMQSGRIPSKP